MKRKISTLLAGLALLLAMAVGAHPADAAAKSGSTKGLPPSGGVTALRTGCATPPCYFYVGGQQTTTNTGAYAFNMVSWGYSDTYASDSGAHSLVEIDAETGSGSTRQIVEVIINADQGMFGNDAPHLSGFWWKNGVGQGYNTGWVDVAGVTPNLGDSLAGDVGLSKKIGIEYIAVAGSTKGWWLSYDNKWIAVLPADPAGGSTATNVWYPQAPFTSASKAQVFGEVASSYNEPCTDMGNGRQGNSVPGGAYNYPTFPSYVSSFALAGTATAPSLTGYTIPSTGKYTQTMLASNRTFYYGGPGWNAAGTATGTAGSC
jgi:hypothetical protein